MKTNQGEGAREKRVSGTKFKKMLRKKRPKEEIFEQRSEWHEVVSKAQSGYRK